MSIFAQQINWSFNTELYGRRGLFLRFALFRAKKLLILCNVDFINPPEATAGLTYRPRCKQDVLTNIKPDGVMNFLTEDCDILGFASQTWLGVLWLSSNSQSEFHLTLKGYEKRWGYFFTSRAKRRLTQQRYMCWCDRFKHQISHPAWWTCQEKENPIYFYIKITCWHNLESTLLNAYFMLFLFFTVHLLLQDT